MKKIIVSNLAIQYYEQGKGKSLLLLHGWGDSSSSFNELIAKLSKNYHIVALDLPGFGGSEAPSLGWGVLDYAEFVLDFTKKIGLQPYGLVGHSLGGRVAIKIASKKILKINRLILLASAGIKESNSFRNQFIKVGAKAGKLALKLPMLKKYNLQVKKSLYSKIGSSDYLQSGNMRETFKRVVNEDLLEDATRIKLPTLLIYGSQDAETPVSYGKKLHEAIDESKLIIMPNAGHFIHHEDPEYVASEIEKFLL